MSLDESLPIPLGGLNPYASPAMGEAVIADVAVPPPPAAVRPPRLWTVFVAVLVTIAAIIGVQIVAGVGLVVWHLSHGGVIAGMEDDLIDLVSQPAVFLGLGVFSQSVLLAIGVSAAWLSPVLFRERLRLVKPRLSAAECAAFVVGAIVPFAIGMSLAVALTHWISEDPSIAKMYSKLTPAWALPFLLFIAIAPGFSEEMLFRGYMQSRLTQRWPVWLAILCVSGFFALVHIQPHTVVFAFPLGIWLGTMAWRAGSIWPSIVCHALVNGLWNLWNLGGKFGYFPEEAPIIFLVALGALGLAAFGWSVWILFRKEPHSDEGTPQRAFPTEPPFSPN